MFADEATKMLEPYVGRTVADTCIRATAIALGKTRDELAKTDLPRLEENILKDKNLDKKDIFFLIYDTVLFFFQDKYIKGTDSDLRLYRIYYILSNMKRSLDDKEKYKDFHVKLKEYRDFLISSTNISTYMINMDNILFEIDDIVLKEKIASQLLGEILSYRIDKDDTESAVIHLKKITLTIYGILNTANISFNKKNIS